MTWPNVLVLKYLIDSGQTNPEIELRAREYISLGYQRLLTFEHAGGGFSWMGSDPPQLVLTAYGLMQLQDMSQVHPVDPNLIARTQDWLANQQSSDGSFDPAQFTPFGTAGSINSGRLRATAFVTWALVESAASGTAAANALAWLRAHAHEAEDDFTRALVAAALLADSPVDSAAHDLLDVLEQNAVAQDGAVSWAAPETGLMYSYGDSVAIETTALAALALMKGGVRPDLVSGALTYLIRAKDPLGNFYTTQATVLTLRTMIESLNQSGASDSNATIEIRHNGQLAATVVVTPQTSDVHRQVDLKPFVVDGPNQVEVTMIGTGRLAYQVVGLHYLPWSLVPDPPPGPLEIEVAYDRTTLQVNEMITATARVRNTLPAGEIPMVMVDLGIPPGFEVMESDLTALVTAGVLQNYEITPRQIIAYVLNLAAGAEAVLTYRLRATMPITGSSEGFSTYAYYSPEIRAVSAPIEVTAVEP